MITISIIVPVYNAEKYIRKNIESVMCQSIPNWQLVIIDDGSPDASGIICDEYAETDERIVVIHKQNEGVSVARNIGIENSSGEYILFLDSDDWLVPNTLELLQRELTSSAIKPDIILYDTIVKTAKQESIIKNPTVSGKKDFMLKLLSRQIGGGVCGKLIRRSIINNIRFTPGQIMAEDALFFTLVADNAKYINQLHEPLYVYNCEVENSTTHTFSKKHLEDSLYTGRVLKEYFFNKDKEYKDAFSLYEARNIAHKILCVATEYGMNAEYELLKKEAKRVDSKYYTKLPLRYRIPYYIGNRNTLRVLLCLYNFLKR